MREILFRAKQTPNSEWIEGSLIIGNNHNFIITKEDYQDVVATQSALVCESHLIEKDNKTLGQYTGLTDKNGKKIFEGDIVEFTDIYTGSKGKAKIVFEYSQWKYSGCYYGGNPIVWLCINDTSVKFEVIGNIYDNPELLEEK